MNITILTQYFPPETCAVRAYELARELQSMENINIDIVTGFPNHPNGNIPAEYKRKLYQRQQMEGFYVHRSFLYTSPRLPLIIRRALADFTLMISALLITANKLRKPDFVIATSPSFTVVIAGYIISKLKGAKFIFDVRDLWPKAISDLGIMKNRFIIGALEWLEMLFYKKCDKIVVVTNSFKEDIVKRGIPENKVKVITNGYNTSLFYPYQKDEELAYELSIKDKFVIGYIGNHGISQALTTLIEAADKLKCNADIVFLLVGEGNQKQSLVKLAKDKGLNNIIFLPPKPKNKIADYYRLCDAAYVPLRNIELFDGFIPSKIFEIMACGIPIIGALRGEAASIITKAQAGIVIEPENINALHGAIIKLKKDSLLRDSFKSKSVIYAKQHYSGFEMAKNYLRVLKELVK